MAMQGHGGKSAVLLLLLLCQHVHVIRLLAACAFGRLHFGRMAFLRSVSTATKLALGILHTLCSSILSQCRIGRISQPRPASPALINVGRTLNLND